MTIQAEKNWGGDMAQMFAGSDDIYPQGTVLTTRL